jgi:hypothetical protein
MMEPEKNTVEKYKDDLTTHLLQSCSGSGLLKGVLLSSPDIDDAWMRFAPSFYGDAVRNFNAYPEYCLACAGYLGMAIAYLWDLDWAKYQDFPYSFFQGERGFDDMDDHITDNILKERKHSVPAMQTCSANAYHFLMRECTEPGTAEAYQFFLVTVEVMFKVGAAIELGRLGYRYEKMNLGN